MAAFFVGQRVRIVRTIAPHRMLGWEARIVRLNVEALRPSGETYVGHMLDVRVTNGCQCIAPPDWLEPILPEGMQPAKWEDCMWQPEGVAA